MLRIVTLAAFAIALIATSAQARVLIFPTTGPKGQPLCLPFPDPGSVGKPNPRMLTKPDPRVEMPYNWYCAPPA